MKFTFVALALLLLVDQVVGYRIHVHVPRVNGGRARSQRKEKERRLQFEREMDLQNMCNYVNKIFGNSPNQCSSPPAKLFRDIYKPSRQTELWQIQQLVCLPKEKTGPAKGFVIFIVIVIITIFVCCT